MIKYGTCASGLAYSPTALPCNRDVRSFGKIPLLPRGITTLLKTLRGTNLKHRLVFLHCHCPKGRLGAGITSPGSMTFSEYRSPTSTARVQRLNKTALVQLSNETAISEV